jgi:hypothetical protein
MSTNEADIIEIKTSAWRTLALGGASLLMTTLGVAIALDLFPGSDVSVIRRVAGIAGALFFGACTIVWFWRYFGHGGVVLTISPQGIRDLRIAPETIPWSAVRKVSSWEHSGQRVLVLDVDPAVERTLHLSMIAKWSRGANRKLGADGLCVTAHGLTISYDQLWALVSRYAAAG